MAEELDTELTGQQLMSLTDTIVLERQLEVDEEFYRDVTERTYDKWFVEPYGKSGKPRLTEGKHGGYMDVYSGPKPRYRMLKRKYYSMKRVNKGGRVYYVPVKSSMERSAQLADKLMRISTKYNVDVTKESPSAVTIRMTYDKPIPDYGKASAFYDRIDAGNLVLSSSRRGGRYSPVDRLIRRAIQKWAATNQITCIIDGTD